MTLGKLADVSLPAQILTVDKRDGLVGLFVRLVVLVCVEARLRCSIAL